MADVKLLIILSLLLMITDSRRIETDIDNFDYEDNDDPLQQLVAFSAKYCQPKHFKNLSQR